MTAAHCVKEWEVVKGVREIVTEMWKYRVRLGKTGLDEGVMIVPKRIIIHPKWMEMEGNGGQKK